MDNPSTDRCGFSRWTFTPPLIELRGVHRLLIKKQIIMLNCETAIHVKSEKIAKYA